MKRIELRLFLPAILITLLVSVGTILYQISVNSDIKYPNITQQPSIVSKSELQGSQNGMNSQFLPVISNGNWGFDCEGLTLGNQNPKNFYVATYGSDSPFNLGTARHPWATITYALEQVPDNSVVWVDAGQYNGQTKLVGKFSEGVTVKSCFPYRAKLRNANNVDQVVVCFTCQGVTLEGFDIAHAGLDSGIYVIQIQDLLKGANGPDDYVQNVTLRNNVIHDSYNNDLIKLNNGARNVTIEGNIFYNQQGLDSHVDINGVQHVFLQDNIFFNDFAGSGRFNRNDTGGFLVIKDSNGDADDILGASDILVRRNIFFNWEGEPAGNAFVSIGEDEKDFYQAYDVILENNLFLGNSPNLMRSAFSIRGSRDITFRNNTISGDLPSYAYAFRLSKHAVNPPNKNINFYNNIWSDPTGTMGNEDPMDWRESDFSDTVPSDTESFVLNNNLYWNGGKEIFDDPEELINISHDPNAILLNPQLPPQDGINPPIWQPQTLTFGDGSTSIRDVFVSLIETYGIPNASIDILGQSNSSFAPTDDILGNFRNKDVTSLGAVEK